MNKQQILELFKLITAVYPNFEVGQYKIDLWTSLMKDQNPAKVMKKAESYVFDNKFPPTIADLSEKKLEAHGNDFLEKVRKWESEAVGYKP